MQVRKRFKKANIKPRQGNRVTHKNYKVMQNKQKKKNLKIIIKDQTPEVEEFNILEVC